MDKRLARIIGAPARTARTRQGLTQADVGERLGIAPEVYGRLERGQMLPSVETLRKLCIALAISADELLGLRGANPSAALAPPSPGYGESSEVRRMIRRFERLDRRKLRLLVQPAAALSR